MSEDRRGGNYYENQFGDRIRDISRGGRSSSPRSRPRRSGSGGRAQWAGGVGGVILLMLIFGVLRAWNSSSSAYRTKVAAPVPNVNRDEVRLLLQQNQFVVPEPLPVQADEAQGASLLRPDDIPYLPALCYLLHKEGNHTKLTPARRIFDLLDADDRALLAEIADDSEHEPAPEKRDAILEALNKVLDNLDLYDARYFRDVPNEGELFIRLSVWKLDDNVPTLREARQLNRLLLEAAFPRQLFSRAAFFFDDGGRLAAIADARRQLTILRLQYDDKKP